MAAKKNKDKQDKKNKKDKKSRGKEKDKNLKGKQAKTPKSKSKTAEKPSDKPSKDGKKKKDGGNEGALRVVMLADKRPAPPPMDEITRRNLLFDYYGPLLSEKQRKMYTLYYEDNLTLSEIAEGIGITRQGVHDAIRKSATALNEYEEKLHLLDKHLEYESALTFIQGAVDELLCENGDALTDKGQRLLNKVSGMISGLDI